MVALQGVSLRPGRGEVLALMGENGAGKSTLMKVLGGGAYLPNEGQVLLDGESVTLGDIGGAKRLGIALIHQELMLAPNLDIAGNIFLGNEARRLGLATPLSRRPMSAAAAAADLMRRVGLNLAPTTPVSNLTAGQMQMVETAKALSLDARVIIMDEPTSSLTADESRFTRTPAACGVADPAARPARLVCDAASGGPGPGSVVVPRSVRITPPRTGIRG